MSRSLDIPVTVRERIGALLASRAGLAPPAWVLDARIAARLGALELDAEAYARRLSAGGDELEALIECLRVGETRFFRHRAHWDALSQTVVPALREARVSGPVRAWSAGCASGEEAYSLAIALARGLPPPSHQVQIIGTDISRDALAVARAGLYSTAAAAQVPDGLRASAFELAPGGQTVRVADWVARLVTFEHGNLAVTAPPRDLDVVFCRNVLIYFSATARTEAIARIVEQLAPGGFLFVGYSETLRDVAELEPIQAAGAVVYRRRARRRAVTAAGPPAAPVGRTETTARPRGATRPPPIGGPPRATPPVLYAALRPATLRLHGRYDDGERLGSELGAVMAGAQGRVTIELDGAEFLGDDAARVLRRALAAADAAGLELALIAERAGTRRWLSRWGLQPAGAP